MTVDYRKLLIAQILADIKDYAGRLDSDPIWLGWSKAEREAYYDCAEEAEALYHTIRTLADGKT